MIDTKGRNRRRILLVGVAAIVLLVAGGIYLFFSGDPAPEADLEATAAAITSTTAATTTAPPSEGTTAAPTTSSAAPSAAIGGSWSIDTSVGEFSVTEQATATFAGFRVDEVLSTIGSTTAIGRTPAVAGNVTIDGTKVTVVDMTADLTQIVSDQSRRDNAIQRALNTSANPDATFRLTAPIELGESAASGEAVAVVASGDLTINGVTQAVEIPLEAQLIDGRILIVGSIELVFADFDVTAPSAPIVVSVEDNGILELQLWLSR